MQWSHHEQNHAQYLDHNKQCSDDIDKAYYKSDVKCTLYKLYVHARLYVHLYFYLTVEISYLQCMLHSVNVLVP